MDRIKEGIIVVDGIELNNELTIADLEKIDLDKAVQRFHPHGYMEVIFNHPVTSDGVDFQVSMRITNNEKHKLILLDPRPKDQKWHSRDALEISREKQAICEDWLKKNMGIEPTRDTDDGIFYDFPWGHVHSAAAEHINFGHLEGCIIVSYGEDME